MSTVWVRVQVAPIVGQSAVARSTIGYGGDQRDRRRRCSSGRSCGRWTVGRIVGRRGGRGDRKRRWAQRWRLARSLLLSCFRWRYSTVRRTPLRRQHRLRLRARSGRLIVRGAGSAGRRCGGQGERRKQTKSANHLVIVPSAAADASRPGVMR